MIRNLADRLHPIWLPLVVAACTLTVVLSVAAAYGYAPLSSSTWARWDSGLYEDIARDGYDLFPCTEEPQKWCGDAGWFPAYPWLIVVPSRLGVPVGAVAVAVAWLFAVGTLVLIWATFLGRQTSGAAAGALFYAAFAPGQIYHYAVFPLSLLAFASVMCLWLVVQERFVLAGIAGAVAALAYPAGVVLAPVCAAWLILQREVSLPERLRRIALTSGLTLVGVWILMLDQRVETGRWDAYFLVQRKYGHKLQSPLTPTWDMLRNAIESFPKAIDVAVGLQTALVTCVLVLVLVDVIRRNRLTPGPDGLLAFWAIASWALPLSEKAVSVQRGQATLLPIAILLARLPGRLVWPLALAAAALAVWMENYFLDGTLF